MELHLNKTQIILKHLLIIFLITFCKSLLYSFIYKTLPFKLKSILQFCLFLNSYISEYILLYYQ